MDAQAATSITGAEDDLKQSIRYSQALRLDDDAVFASSGGTGSTGATGSTGGSSEELTSASNVMKKLWMRTLQPEIVTTCCLFDELKCMRLKWQLDIFKQRVIVMPCSYEQSRQALM